MITQLREWLAEKPYDGTSGRQASIAVETDDDGNQFDSLCVFEDGNCICGFTYPGILDNLSKAGEWCASPRQSATPQSR